MFGDEDSVRFNSGWEVLMVQREVKVLATPAPAPSPPPAAARRPPPPPWRLAAMFTTARAGDRTGCARARATPCVPGPHRERLESPPATRE